MVNYEDLKNNFFMIAGPNVIESREHVLFMAKNLKEIFQKHNIQFIFKTSIDKANRSSLNSYRGLGFTEGLEILKQVKEELNIPIITDIHESYQADLVKDVVDIIQIPAFLCRQTDILEAAAKTGKIIHVKKGQFCSAEQLHKCKEKIQSFGNNKVILCERGSFFGYTDLIVDARNLIWMQSESNLVTMDITHCLQQPSQKMSDGTIKSGGLREMIPYMARMAMSLDVNGIFMEVHSDPDNSKCDAPTQWPLEKLEEIILLKNKFYHKPYNYNDIICCIPARLQSERLPEKLLLKINNKTIIQHVYKNVEKSNYIDNIVVLTDSEKIKETINNIGGRCELIKESCKNGTERIIKYLNQENIKNKIVVNVQGDEPFINSKNIDLAITNFMKRKSNDVVCSTLFYTTNNINEITDPNRGKCLLDKDSNIIYCSRSPVPTNKKGKIISDHNYKIHVGIFVYDANYLMNNFYKENTQLQTLQDIEWLKIIEQGYKINAVEAKNHEIGIDTIKDYVYLKEKYKI
tara:strand:+ start:59 stop:1615 length:1557 start_codon:yes stop_codon:yes gene_type:complete